MAEEIYSVGIDVGTTTTQVVFSRLSLERRGGFASIPNVKITKKDVVFKSEIHFTPLLSPDVVDAACLKKIVAAEYRKSALCADDIATGAVIITGETARKENAREVARELSDFAGDFVVCTAGPDYEAVLAGWGSGAGDTSRKLAGNVLNFDIGGGTTNAAVFENGAVSDAFAADIGGRLVRVDSQGTVTYVSDKIRFLTQTLSLGTITEGERADMAELRRLTDRMAGMFPELCGERKLQPDTERLFIGHPKGSLGIGHVMFSGGVAEYIYRNSDEPADESPFRHGDIGPLLGDSIRRVLPGLSAVVHSPRERIRATVVGAGSYSTGISGSTIAFDGHLLPIKNLPVVKEAFQPAHPGLFSEKTAARARLFDGEPVAVAVSGIERPRYADIRALAAEILSAMRGGSSPVIVITECDCAKALGLVIRSMIGPSRPMICLDRISVENGDYIDIGRPVCGVVPVVVKTLLFGG